MMANNPLSDLVRDLRLSSRQMVRSPSFTVAAVLCLALGIGGTSATFTFAHSLLGHVPQVAAPDRLVRMYVDWSSGLRHGSFSYPDYRDVRDRAGIWEGLAAESPIPLHLSVEGRNERLWGAIVSGNYFQVLGVKIARGRGFLPAEDRTPGSHPVVVLSHGLWQRRCGGDPEIVGRRLVLNGREFTVVGVAPEGFYGPSTGMKAELWVPMMMQEVVRPGRTWLEIRGAHWLTATIGRLQPGVSFEQARERVSAVMAELVATYPDTNTGKTVVLYPEAQSSLHPMYRDAFVGSLAMLFVLVVLVLALACFNVAGLLLARAAGRSREIAVRLALGAGRGRLIRQLLTEATLLAVVGGGVGLVLSLWLVRALRAVQLPVDLPLEIAADVDLTVVAFTFGGALLSGILFGLAPAWQATRPQLVPALKEGGAAAGGRSWLLKGVVVFQVMISLILLIAAGMVLRSLDNARRIDVGFAPHKQLMAAVDLGLQGYDEAAGRNFFRTLKERVAALPGVEAVGYAEVVPLAMYNQQNSALPSGYEIPDGSEAPIIDYNLVGPGYFEAMGIPILRGRDFGPADGPDGAPVVIVNEALARRYWPGKSALGERLETFGAEHVVVGVVKTGRYRTLGEAPRPYYYAPAERYYRGAMNLHLRTAGDPTLLAESVRREVRALDETLPVYNLRPMSEHLGFVLMVPRLFAVVVGAFAVLALVLAAIGLYAVVAYQVSQGVREVAVRMALGARRADVLRLVVWQGVGMTAVGGALGLVFGIVLSWLAASVLYGLPAVEAPIYLVACGVLVAVAVVASWVPARRASLVDPMTVLRAE